MLSLSFVLCCSVYKNMELPCLQSVWGTQSTVCYQALFFALSAPIFSVL